jgi:hypothetical protein
MSTINIQTFFEKVKKKSNILPIKPFIFFPSFNTKPPPSQAGVYWQKLIKLVETVN